MSARRSLLFAAFALPLALAGCKIETINYFPQSSAPVRFANFVADAPGLDTIVDNASVWTATAPEGLTPYRDFDPVQHSFGLRISGGSANLGVANYTLSGDQRYTLFAFGTAALPALLMSPDLNADPGSGNFRARVIHLAPSVGAIDMYVSAPDADIANLAPNVNTLNYGSTGLYVNYPPGDYRLRVTPFGTKTVIYDSGRVGFPGSTTANLVVYSRGSGTLVNLARLDTTGNTAAVTLDNRVARVRAVHLANATDTLNLLADQAALFPGLAYGVPAAYASLAGGAHDFSVESVSAPGATLARIARTLRPASDTTLYVQGVPGAQSIVALDDNNVSALSGAVRVRVVNVSGGGATVDVLAGDTVIASAIGPTATPRYVDIVSGSYTLTVRDTATGTTLATQTGFAPAIASVHTLYVAGTATQTTLVVAQDR